MGALYRRRPRPISPVGALVLVLAALTVFGLGSHGGTSGTGASSVPTTSSLLPSPTNGSTGGDPPSSTDATLCPSAGPVILNVQWNCVAVLDLTELALILVSVGIVAFVFRDDDRAELPGESEEVPVTAEEWEEFRRARRLGVPYTPPPPASRKEER
jgi:hypothetical protein